VSSIPGKLLLQTEHGRAGRGGDVDYGEAGSAVVEKAPGGGVGVAENEEAGLRQGGGIDGEGSIGWV